MRRTLHHERRLSEHKHLFATCAATYLFSQRHSRILQRLGVPPRRPSAYRDSKPAAHSSHLARLLCSWHVFRLGVRVSQRRLPHPALSQHSPYHIPGRAPTQSHTSIWCCPFRCSSRFLTYIHTFRTLSSQVCHAPFLIVQIRGKARCKSLSITTPHPRQRPPGNDRGPRSHACTSSPSILCSHPLLHMP